MLTLEDLQNDIHKQIAQLNSEEQTLFKQLDTIFDQKTYIDGKIKGLTKLIPTLNLLKNEAQDLVNTVNDISESSEKISGKIRALDTARSRVEECQKRVSDLIDLEICSQGVQMAILDSDYETGAAHVHRFLSMDQSLLKKTATDVENVSNMMKSVRTLQDAAGQLRALVEHKFNEAIQNEDLPGIERFFKIFPLLGMYDEGIREFSTYLRSKIAATAEKNLKSALNTPPADKRYGVLFSDVITLLFEGLARIIETHQPLIETYYGPGRMIASVEILQKECDVQIRRILMEWSKIRQISRKIAVISEWSLNKTPATGVREKIEAKDLDILIVEITMMHSRSELYQRFVQRKIMADVEVGIRDREEKQKILNRLETVLKTSEFTATKHEFLSYYLRLEQYFMEESIAKAVAMDSVDSAAQTSSMVDDTFFIVRKCIRRAISGGSLDGICTIINNACRVLENDFCEVLKTKLKQGYPSGYLDLSQAYNVLQTSIQQGRLQPGDTEQARTTFLIALNNADSSTEYVEALCDNVLKEIEMALPQLNENERGKLESCLSGLSSVTSNLKEIIDYGMQQLKASAIKPRINPWVDSFLNISHQLTEDELSAYEAGDTFVQTLIMNLETLLASFRNVLTTSNFDAFVSLLATEVTQRFEKVIMKTIFNRLGGLVLDKEVRALAGYVTGATSWSVRDKFARLTQIATVLNLENVTEIHDYWGAHDGALTWRLTPSEIRNTMALRIDFRADDVRRLRL